MGGFGVIAWLAIGVVAGWTITRLMVTSGDEGLRGTAAGMVGGILGGLAIPGANDLDILLAALAASLWLTWITCVVSSGREHRARPRTPAVAGIDVNGRPLLGTRLQTLAERVRAG
jgi:hypothetical protein